MKIAIVPSLGLGDALIFQIAAHHLSMAGMCVEIDSPHDFGVWFEKRLFLSDSFDAIFLQHDNSEKAKRICALPNVYTFYGSHREDKHGKLKEKDYVCDQEKTMVENVVLALKKLFGIEATKETGASAPQRLIHRKCRRRVAIHHTSSREERSWPEKKFLGVMKWLEGQGYQPELLPHFHQLEEMMAYIYESGFFIGNDSGPGHAASLLGIPHLIIGRNEREMKLWQPGWLQGAVALPPPWMPFKIKELKWKQLTTKRNAINLLKKRVLIE